MRQTTVRYAIKAVSCGPNWPCASSGSGACVVFPHPGQTTGEHWYSVMWALSGGNSVT